MKIITLLLPILVGYLLSTVPCHAYRDLETGVFLSRDPAGQVDGPNVYTYVNQNPWTTFDPEGLWGWNQSNGGVTDAAWNWTRDTTKGMGSLAVDTSLVGAFAPGAGKRNLARAEGMGRLGVMSTGIPASSKVINAVAGKEIIPDILGQRAFESNFSNDFTGGSGNSGWYRATYTALNTASIFVGEGVAKATTLAKAEVGASKALTAAERVAAKGPTQFAEGSFSITEHGWQGYPAGVPKPAGPFRLIEGAEYDAARSAANSANNQIRLQQGLRGQPVDVHELKPVKFGGSATNPANKLIMDRATHRQQVTPWWNQLMRDITGR
jgi:hypothetical protein